MMTIFSNNRKKQGQTIRVGVIGLGNISAVHLAAFQESRHSVVCAAADTDASRFAKSVPFLPPDQCHRDYHDLLADRSVDVVDILLPHRLHAPVIREALKAGKHVICEKPLVIDPKDVDSIAAISGKTKRYVYLKQYFRFSDIHKKLQNTIATGVIGRPYLVSCLYTTDAVKAYNDRQSWRGSAREAGGGVFMDVGVHILDYLQEIFGYPQSVYAVTRKNFTSLPSKGEDMSAVTLEFRGGLIASIICSAADTSYGFRWEKHFYGSSGSCHLVDFGKDRIDMCLQKEGETVLQDSEDGWWMRANISAIHDIIGRLVRHEPPAVSMTDAKHVLVTVLSAYKSAKTGKKIFLL